MKDKEKFINPLKSWQILGFISSIFFLAQFIVVEKKELINEKDFNFLTIGKSVTMNKFS